MPTGYFETERSQAETPVEEIRDFDFLIEEIRGATREEAEERLSYWVERFQRGWTNGSDQWTLLVDLLPRPEDIEPTIGQFRKQLLSATREASASDVFLAHPAIAPKLSSYAWTDFLGSQAVGFVAGCLNLARAAAQSGSPSSTVMGTLSNALANYSLTLIGVALHDPDLVVATDDGCSLADALDVPRERFARWSFDKSEQDVQRLIATFELEKVLQVIRSLLGQTELPASTVEPFVKVALDVMDEPRAAALIGAFAFESPDLSAAMRERCFRDGARRAEMLALWARYVSLDDAFAFGWECIRPGAGAEPPPFGERLEERLKRLEELLRIRKTSAGPSQPESGSGAWQWREPALRAMAAIGSLVTRRWTQREDQMVAEEDVGSALASCPALVPVTVSGILDHCQPWWDVLDPIILRLPTDVVVPILTDYSARASVWSDSRHHAARLLAQTRGTAVPGEPEGEPPPAPETLREPARERRAMAAQTWLAEGATERLWHVALEAAQSQFDEAIATRYSEDKDELCAELADGLARAFNGTNAALRAWLRAGGAPPATIRAAVRRIPAKARRAGAGLQADLAFLVRCKILGKCVTKRITLVQARKLAVTNGQASFPSDFKVNGAERTQLTRLLTLSSATHYLFMLPRELGESVRVLPGALVRDLLAGQGFGAGIPVRTVVEAGMRLPEFMLFQVLGFWTGDDDKDLIAKAESDDVDQRPRVVLEVSLSKD